MRKRKEMADLNSMRFEFEARGEARENKESCQGNREVVVELDQNPRNHP